jgi:CRISPR-associated protein Cas2
MLTIICYDIADNRRRNRVARALEGWGQRVQDSVFECHLDPTELDLVKTYLDTHLDKVEDKIRYYTLCGKDRADIHTLGKGHVTDHIAYWLA